MKGPLLYNDARNFLSLWYLNTLQSKKKKKKLNFCHKDDQPTNLVFVCVHAQTANVK